MKDFIKSKREIISLLVYAVLIGLLVYALIIPLLAKITLVRDQIQENEIKREIKDQNIKELPKIEQQYEMVNDNKQFLDVLVDKNNAVPLIEKLEALADTTGNKIIIEVQEETNQQKTTAAKNKNNQQENALVSSLPSSNYLKLKTTLIGDLQSIGKYIYLLEKFDYFGDIIGVQIGDKTKGNKVDFSANMFGENKDLNVKQSQPEGEMEAVLDLVFYAK